ncbi:MAG: FxsA family protein [Rhodospirillaceae bacterium]|nr:FxsA family protein [Rhodospirillaceae bacterium]
MGFLILLLLIAVPLIEIGLFVEVGGWVGGWSTVGLVILTAVVGLALVRIQGLGVLKKLNSDMQGGTFPVGAAFDGIALFMAGAMLLTPGFMTDTLGFLLLIPPLRAFLGKKLQARAHFSGVHASYSSRHHANRHHEGRHEGHNENQANPSIGPHPSGPSGGITIEGEFEEIKKDDS